MSASTILQCCCLSYGNIPVDPNPDPWIDNPPGVDPNPDPWIDDPAINASYAETGDIFVSPVNLAYYKSSPATIIISDITEIASRGRAGYYRCVEKQEGSLVPFEDYVLNGYGRVLGYDSDTLWWRSDTSDSWGNYTGVLTRLMSDPNGVMPFSSSPIYPNTRIEYGTIESLANCLLGIVPWTLPMLIHKDDNHYLYPFNDGVSIAPYRVVYAIDYTKLFETIEDFRFRSIGHNSVTPSGFGQWKAMAFNTLTDAQYFCNAFRK